MSKTFEEIKVELKSASDEMYKSLMNDDLADVEKQEWYGYLRALRDIAYFMGVANEIGVQVYLEKALSKVIDKDLADKLGLASPTKESL